MGFDRKATSIWEGDLQSGSGKTTFDHSGAAGPLHMEWDARAGEAKGTSPEELIAAAHATCYSMALSGALAKADMPPERLEVSAVVTFSTEGGAHIESSKLTVVGIVPGADEQAFMEAATAARDGCPVSKALAGNIEITLDASLKS
ncbi:MAG: OsmC family peroxiredoxin [Nitriliruptorales bacterium]|nr:OsmC family peroxiredoxin [Nitriliruptorales bacterium]